MECVDEIIEIPIHTVAFQRPGKCIEVAVSKDRWSMVCHLQMGLSLLYVMGQLVYRVYRRGFELNVRLGISCTSVGFIISKPLQPFLLRPSHCALQWV